MMKKWLSTLSIFSLIFVLGACNDEGDEESAENTEDTPSEEEIMDEAEGEMAEMPEPDLDDIPEVVAEVNGTEITQEEFTQTYESQFQQFVMQQQMMGGGEDIDQDELKQMVADSLIDQELLVQEADSRDFTADEDEVNALIDELVEQNGMENSDDLYAAFEEQGMPEDEVNQLIETQLKVEQLVEDEVGEIEASDEELEEMYDEMVAQQGEMAESDEEPPSFDEVRPQLEEQFVMQREQEATMELIDTLKEDADTEIHL